MMMPKKRKGQDNKSFFLAKKFVFYTFIPSLKTEIQ